ncbi:MAG: GAF domain-containing protein [Sphingomonas bacterium]|nr:GAF domain-containing protein [Sphingomonas bacterium]
MSKPVLDAIQPAGFFILLSDDWSVLSASANLRDFLPCDAGDLIGRPLSTLFSDDAIHTLRNRLALLRDPDGIERVFNCPLHDDSKGFDVAIHCVGDDIILEAEPSSGKNYGDMTGTLRAMVGQLEQSTSLGQLLNLGARQLRSLTGVDRVLIARHVGDGAGAGDEVVAECVRGGLESLVGQRFDCDALSASAGGLYVIADVEAETVALLPGLDAPLDLSRAILRVAPPAELAFLRRFEARAAMGIALIVGGKPWGVVAFHHHLPRSPSFERRAMVELFAAMFAMRIEISELREQSPPARS